MKKLFCSIFFVLLSMSLLCAQTSTPFSIHTSEFASFTIRQNVQTLKGGDFDVQAHLRKRKLEVDGISYRIRREGINLYAMVDGYTYHGTVDGNFIEAEGRRYKMKRRKLLDLEGNKVGEAHIRLGFGRGTLKIYKNVDTPKLVLALFYYCLLDRIHNQAVI